MYVFCKEYTPLTGMFRSVSGFLLMANVSYSLITQRQCSSLRAAGTWNATVAALGHNRRTGVIVVLVVFAGVPPIFVRNQPKFSTSNRRPKARERVTTFTRCALMPSITLEYLCITVY